MTMDKKNILMLSVCLWYLGNTLSAVIILVHGAFAKNALWYRPGGDFYEALKKRAADPLQRIISFRWSGKPFEKDIVRAAQQLALFIATYPKFHDTENIILIGHSHGGNVILKASQLLENPYSNYGVNDASSDHTSMIFTARLRTFMNSSTLISRAFLLGTPINEKLFKPSMNTIKELCLLYSKSDFVQPVGGLYARTLSYHPRHANIKIWINGSGPDHSDMHHPLIGSWILSIPEGLKNTNASGFDLFSWGVDGGINFCDNQLPEYFFTKDFDGITDS